VEPIVVTPPDRLPFSLTTAIRQLGALVDDVDNVDFHCRAAIASVEDYTGRALVTRTLKLRLSQWPDFSLSYGINRQADRRNNLCAIPLHMSPLVAIASVKYYPADGTARVTWDAANYRADTATLPGRIVFVDGVTLPSLATREDAVEIEYTAGYGLKESSMPPMLVQAILQLARHWMDNPMAVDVEGTARRMPYSYQVLLRSQRV
jgi:uncharacterized phiE125 gp8 family phage protein